MSDFTGRIANLEDECLSQKAIARLHLLQASAGTGKTYSIQTIYLRLIIIEGVTVQQILTVTFTKDATKELRDRLQGVLREALDYLEDRKRVTNPEDRTKIIVDVAINHHDVGKAKARERLRLALLDFDMAAIYTIHGFCQRVLTRFAFETRQGFDVEPASNADEEIEQLSKDWWRKNVYNMDKDIAGFLSENDSFSLNAITKLAKQLITKPDAIVDIVNSSGDSVGEMIQKMLIESLNSFSTLSVAVNLPAGIQAATNEIRQSVAHYSDKVKNREWGNAAICLGELAAMEMRLDNPVLELAAILQDACADLKSIMARASRNDYFFSPDRTLRHVNRPALTSAKSFNVCEAVTLFMETAAMLEQTLPINLFTRKDRTKAFLAAAALHDHFTLENELAAEQFAETVRILADGSLGLKREIVITAEMIVPSIGEIAQSLQGTPLLHAALAIRKTYQQSRASARSASFNDYLINLREALKDNDELVKVLRDEFRAALIDEFQDTDPIQWGIFEKLFKDAPIPCFLVGDPKQAIYRFRNGDITTYTGATRAIAARYELNKNFRSEKRLIDAINQIFMDIDGHPTFGEGIHYDAPLAAAGKPPGESLLTYGYIDDRPFKILLIKKRNKSQNARLAFKLTAQEIAGILNDENQTIGGRRVEAQDIAVLVNRHREAQGIALELKSYNIPSVRQGTGNVWQTDEGNHLWVMLEAILDARNPNPVRMALISSWGGISPEQIQMLNDGKSIPLPYGKGSDPQAMEHFVEIFVDLRETWQKRGYPAMFRKLMSVFALKQRLLAGPDMQGQRRLANIIHLSELIERKIIEARKTPEAILAWVRRQFDKETADGGDEAALRLETDDNAVRIMTIFASKGLEFPIVFAPTLFMMDVNQRGETYEYHDDEGNLRIVRKTNGKQDEEHHKHKERKEIEEEQVRQIYVALTRAVHRTVLFALNDGQSRGSLGKLLQLPALDAIEETLQPVDGQHDVYRRFDKTKATCAIEIRVAGEGQAAAGLENAPADGFLVEPPEQPKVETSYGHGSFSSIAPHERRRANEPQPAVAADEEARNRDGETTLSSEIQPPAQPEGIFAFPSGARTGTCWHSIFEEIDFNADDDYINAMVENKLRSHGFIKTEKHKQERLEATAAMVRNVLRTPLTNHHAKAFAFSDIANGDRKTEWEFSFGALCGKRTEDLKSVIAKVPQYRPFTDALGEWDKEIPGGYLTGFVDLLFRRDGRYFIADWKSNRRNATRKDFDQAGLVEEISLHRYWLQYLIYTVAVHQYLSKALPGYNYENHFGGIYYIFLRGVDGKMQDVHTNGIYYDRPPLALVEDLSSILGGFS